MSGPASARPRAIALPRPLLPPVTRATRPERSKRLQIMAYSLTQEIYRATNPAESNSRHSLANTTMVTTVVRPWFGRATSNLARECDRSGGSG